MSSALSRSAKVGEPRRPLVSVVIPAYNAQAHLAECVSSVQRQRGEFGLEIVIVDDGSTDLTAAVAGSLPDVICVSQANAGPSAARNAGVRRSRGEWVAFLDADDLWPADSLSARLAVAQRLPEAALVFGDCQQFNETGPWRATLFESGGLGTRTWGRSGTVPNAYAALLRNNFITTGTVLVRRQLLQDHGGFSEDLRLVEDLELWLRLARQHTVAWCETLCLLRRRHAHNTSNDAEAMAQGYLQVLLRQPSAVDANASAGDDLQDLIAVQHLELARWAALRGDGAESLRQARSALARRWSWRGTWLMCRASIRLKLAASPTKHPRH